MVLALAVSVGCSLFAGPETTLQNLPDRIRQEVKDPARAEQAAALAESLEQLVSEHRLQLERDRAELRSAMRDRSIGMEALQAQVDRLAAGWADRANAIAEVRVQMRSVLLEDEWGRLTPVGG